jgi:hypothetical protein
MNIKNETADFIECVRVDVTECVAVDSAHSLFWRACDCACGLWQFIYTSLTAYM